MIDAPLALAFTAGLVATVNPCGFAMLPAYLSWFVGVDGEGSGPGSPAPLGRALAVSALVSATFLVVFAIAGIAISAGALVIVDVIPWVAMGVGIGVVALGVAMLRGWKPVVALPQPSSGVRGRGARGVVLFGFSYAVASLSCTLPVFLVVVASSLTTANFVSGVVAFVAYGAGMSLVLVAVAVAVAFTRDAFVHRLRRASRHVDRVAAVLLVVAGLYVFGFWAFTLAVPPGSADQPWWAAIADWPVARVDQASAWAINTLQRWAAPVVTGLVIVVLAAVATLARSRRAARWDGADREAVHAE